MRLRFTLSVDHGRLDLLGRVCTFGKFQILFASHFSKQPNLAKLSLYALIIQVSRDLCRILPNVALIYQICLQKLLRRPIATEEVLQQISFNKYNASHCYETLYFESRFHFNRDQIPKQYEKSQSKQNRRTHRKYQERTSLFDNYKI